MIDRLLTPRLAQSKKSILLLGPRQVGKSTLAQSLKPHFSINLADEGLFLSYSKDPDRLKREILALKHPGLVLIDEIQRLPQLLNTVQALLDSNVSQRFILTGSSARKLKRGGANLLPGRVILEYMDPLTIWELKNHLNLNQVLQQGSLPGIYLDLQDGPQVLETYATVYIREEIQAEAASKNIGGYARFLDAAAQASGHWINFSKIASDSEIPKETVRRFFGLLENTLLAIRIPAWRPKTSHRHISQRDRFIFFDTGVRNALLKLHQGSLSEQEKGFLFEQWFILQCFYYSRFHRKNWKISSFRTDNGSEVDIIIETPKRLLAIEVKYSLRAHETDARGLRSFERFTNNPPQKFIIYRGDIRQKFSGGETALAYHDFLLNVLPAID